MNDWSRKIGWLSLLISGLVLFGCDASGQALPIAGTPPIDTQSPETENSSNVVTALSVTGLVTVQKARQATQQNVQPGTVLGEGDTLLLTEGSTVALNCLDNTIWYVPHLAYTFDNRDCPPARNDINMIVVREGDAQLKILGAPNFTPVADGTLARRGDEILVSGSADVHILCSVGSEWHEIPKDTIVNVADGCPLGDCLLCDHRMYRSPIRAGLDPKIPYLITPRSTNLLTPTPLLRWNRVADATEYTVSIVGEGFDWKTTTTETELRYPGEPAIKPGQVYLLKVVADNGRSSDEEGTPRLGFVRLDGSTAGLIQGRLDDAAALDLTPESLAIYQSVLYANANLIAEAITLLEQTARNFAHVRIYLTLGDLYRQIGLPLEARDAYDAALALDGTTDVRAVAATYDGLGKTYLMLGRIEDAGEAFKEAQAQYTEAQEFGLAASAENQWRELEE